jgi:hypothetical protein
MKKKLIGLVLILALAGLGMAARDNLSSGFSLALGEVRYATNQYWLSNGNFRTDGVIESFGPGTSNGNGLKLYSEPGISGLLTMTSAGVFSFSVETKAPTFTGQLVRGYYAQALTASATEGYAGAFRLTPLYVGDGIIATVVVHTAGTGYKVNDVLAVASGTGGTVTVASISGGGGTGPVTAVTVSAGGLGYTPTAGLITTGGFGTGCKITVSTVTARTITRHNYIDINDITLTYGAAVPNATVFRFDANAGTHKAVDSASGFATAGWIKVNLNGTLTYIPLMSATSAVGSSSLSLLTLKGTGAYDTSIQAGAASASKTYTLPLTDGTSGQALTTNGSAVLSWGPAAGLTAFSSSATGLTYTNTTGVFSLTAGYMIPGGGTQYQVLMSQGASAPSFSTPTFSVTATAGNALIGDGTNWTSADILSSVPTGLTYTTSTRALSLTANYTIPGTANVLGITYGGTGAATFALNGILYGNAASPVGVTAIGAEGQILRVGATPFVPAWTTATYPATATTTGAYLRADGTNWISSTLILPNAGTIYKLPVYSAANTITELAAVGATGEYLAGATGAIPSWATLNQAAVAGLTTSDTPSFVGIKSTGSQITPGSGAGLTVNSAGNAVHQVYKVTVTFAGYSVADLTADKVIATLPAKTKLIAMYADTTVPYTGGTVAAATLMVGKGSGGAEYLAVHDVLSSVITKGLLDADMGTELLHAATIQGGAVVNWTGTIAVTVRITTTVDTCDHLTAGSTTFYLITERY